MLSYALLSVLVAAPQVLPFTDAPGLVRDGALTKKGKQAIATAAGQIPAGSTVTVIGCANDKVTVNDARQLAGVAAAELRAKNAKIPVSTVVRNTTEKCPAGFFVEVGPGADSTAPEAKILAAKGKVEGQLPDGRVIPLYKGSVINPAGIITTGEGSRCTVSLPDGSVIRVADNARLSLDEFQKANVKTRKVTLKLMAGKAWAKVASLMNDESTWELDTSNAIAGVRGTSFQLSADEKTGTPSTQIGVHEGAVVVDVGLKSVQVPEGYGTKAAGTDVNDPQPLPPAPTGLKPEQGTFVKKTIASWNAVAGAVEYRLEVASDVQFTDLYISQIFKDNKVWLASPQGTFYWRVIAIDKDGFESSPSALYRIIFRDK